MNALSVTEVSNNEVIGLDLSREESVLIISKAETIPSYMVLPSPPQSSRQQQEELLPILLITTEEEPQTICNETLSPLFTSVIVDDSSTQLITESTIVAQHQLSPPPPSSNASTENTNICDGPICVDSIEIVTLQEITETIVNEPASSQKDAIIIQPSLPPVSMNGRTYGRTTLKSKLDKKENINAIPQTFIAPDGVIFTSKSFWRDYMVQTYYSFKNKSHIETSTPLMKRPGEVDGQCFEISDCIHSTLVVMDICEQVQIDEVHNCRIFIGACASSIFIRNCTNCVFYTCCRQLRLRDVTHSDFYTFSMSEVHIEYSNTLRFAPFNGGYAEQAIHLKTANLDPTLNLWYDIFDHNDQAKSHTNWSLLPVTEYEPAWYPTGA